MLGPEKSSKIVSLLHSLNLFKRRLQDNPENAAELHFLVAQTLMDLANETNNADYSLQALTALDAAIEYPPRNPLYLAHRALCHAKRGNTALAQADLESIRELPLLEKNINQIESDKVRLESLRLKTLGILIRQGCAKYSPTP